MLTVKLNGTKTPPFAVPSITMTGEPAGGNFEVEELELALVQPTSVPATPVKSSTNPTWSIQRLRFPKRRENSPSSARGAAVANSIRPCFPKEAFVESTETVSNEVAVVAGGVDGTVEGMVLGVNWQ